MPSMLAPRLRWRPVSLPLIEPGQAGLERAHRVIAGSLTLWMSRFIGFSWVDHPGTETVFRYCVARVNGDREALRPSPDEFQACIDEVAAVVDRECREALRILIVSNPQAAPVDEQPSFDDSRWATAFQELPSPTVESRSAADGGVSLEAAEQPSVHAPVAQTSAIAQVASAVSAVSAVSDVSEAAAETALEQATDLSSAHPHAALQPPSPMPSSNPLERGHADLGTMAPATSAHTAAVAAQRSAARRVYGELGEPPEVAFVL